MHPWCSSVHEAVLVPLRVHVNTSRPQRISLTSRRLIRKARVDMDFRLSRAGAMLGDLLDEELSEAHVGLSTSARAHLNRFRAHVHRFYCTRFGSFPPPAADPKCSTIFRPDAYRAMKADFETLYRYLVDVNFTTTDNAPLVAQGGLCALQSVHEFDLRHKFTPLDHPLPLLPAPLKAQESRRRRSVPWFMGGVRSCEAKLRPDQRLAAHAALMRATNHMDIDLLDNELVMSYRQFEEASVMHQPQHKGLEHGVTPGDARKVRWLFIYAMYQTLRSCAETPREVRYASSNVNYHLGVSSRDILPWQAQNRSRPSTASTGQQGTDTLCPRHPERGRSIGAVPLLSPLASMSPKGFELKPDIDYFALTHQETSEISQGRGPSSLAGCSLPPSRSQSLTRNLSRSLSVFRHSVSTQRGSAMSSATPKSRSDRKSVYHEIIVQGYGNGTNKIVNVAEGTEDNIQDLSRPLAVVTTCVVACRSASTSSTTSNSSLLSASPSTAAQSSVSTLPTTLGDPHSPTSSRHTSESWRSTNTLVPPEAQLLDKPNHHHALTDTPETQKAIRSIYSNDDMLHATSPPPLPRRSSKRDKSDTRPKTGTPTNKRWSLVDVSASLREDDSASEAEDELQPGPLCIRKTSYTTSQSQTHDADDDVFQVGMSKNTRRAGGNTGDASIPYVWEQYADLGGLKTVKQLGLRGFGE